MELQHVQTGKGKRRGQASSSFYLLQLNERALDVLELPRFHHQLLETSQSCVILCPVSTLALRLKHVVFRFL